MPTDIRDTGVQNLESVRMSNRDLFERALQVRAMSYLAQQKIALMKQTIFEVDRSKEVLNEQMRELAQSEATIARQNDELEQRTRALEEVQHTLEERVRQRTAEIEQANSKLRNEIAERERVEKERRALGEQYLRAQKMELVGRLAGGVAHDFNNLLTVILGSGELLRTRLFDTSLLGDFDAILDACDCGAALAGKLPGPMAQEFGNLFSSILASSELLRDRVSEVPLAGDVDAIVDACRRGGALTRQLLAFARKQPRDPAVLAPGQVIRNFARLLRRVLGSNVELELAIADQAGNVRIGVSELEQIVLNLVVNAKDAMPQGGKISIRVDPVVLDEAERAPRGACLAICVRDTGEGMSEEVRRQVFEPFFTTKPAGVGTGLGLATVDMIVRDYGGRVEVESRPGEGAAFTVYLPGAEGACEAELAVPENFEELPRGQREIVLVVDDDANVRRVVAEQLKLLGYRVQEADCARAALALLERERPNLLLVDSVMPGMSGDDLAVEAALRWPKLAVVSMSGYSNRPRPHDLAGRPFPFVEKPLEIHRLALTLRTVLGGSGASH